MQPFPSLSLLGFLLIPPRSFGRSAILFLPLSLLSPHLPNFPSPWPWFCFNNNSSYPHKTHAYREMQKNPHPSNIITTMIWGRVNSRNKIPGFIAPAEIPANCWHQFAAMEIYHVENWESSSRSNCLSWCHIEQK